jgi:hypothetical protein
VESFFVAINCRRTRSTGRYFYIHSRVPVGVVIVVVVSINDVIPLHTSFSLSRIQLPFTIIKLLFIFLSLVPRQTHPPALTYFYAPLRSINIYGKNSVRRKRFQLNSFKKITFRRQFNAFASLCFVERASAPREQKKVIKTAMRKVLEFDYGRHVTEAAFHLANN